MRSISFRVIVTAILVFPFFCCLSEAKRPSLGDFHKDNKQQEQLMGEQHSPLGFLDATGIFQVGHDEIKVKYVSRSGPAGMGGLEEGDWIVGANGQSFSKATASPRDGGKGPREELGMAMEESLADPKKILMLTVMREPKMSVKFKSVEVKRKKVELKIELPDKIKPYSRTYPVKCERSEDELMDICKWLIQRRDSNGAWGGPVQSATAGMGVLSTGNKKFKKIIRQAALNCPTSSGGLDSWGMLYAGTFMCEYYLATGHSKIIPKIEPLVREMEKRTTSNGRHGHGAEVGYNGVGINIITTHVLLLMALSNECGIDIDMKKGSAWRRAVDHVKASTSGDGYVGYIINGVGYDEAARTGLFTLAMDIADDEREIKARCSNHLATYYRGMREAHACGLFGMIWGTAALKSTDKKGYRDHMDYWKWYMNMGKAPKGEYDVERFYIPAKGNCGGDGYLGFDLYNHAAMAMFLGSGNGNLWVHGNRQKEWYVGSRTTTGDDDEEDLEEDLFPEDDVDDTVDMAKKREEEEKARIAREAEQFLLVADRFADEQHEYKLAYQSLMQAKSIDPNADIASRLTKYRDLSKNKMKEIVVPLINDKSDYYMAYMETMKIIDEFGPECAPSAVSIADRLGRGEQASAQIEAGKYLHELALGVRTGDYEYESVVERLAEIISRHSETTVDRDARLILARIMVMEKQKSM